MHHDDSAPAPARRWPSRAIIWRWHFYAGLFCIPFILLLAATGSVYLWRAEIEALLDRPYAAVTAPGQSRATPSAIAQAAEQARPGMILHRYILPATRTQAVQVVVGEGRRETRVWVHPRTLELLKVEDEDARPMNLLFHLHGELLLGTMGSYAVELAASWAVVMIGTGLVLWWPRGRRLSAVLLPRVTLRRRDGWRALHGAVGLWVSVAALGFLLTGLPWARSWGLWLDTLRSAAGEAPQGRDWSVSREEMLARRAARDAEMRGGHQHMPGRHPAVRIDHAALDRLMPIVERAALPTPVALVPPAASGRPWVARVEAADRTQRSDLELDGASGRVLARHDFAQRPLVDRVVAYGATAHEGRLWGRANQFANLVVALGLMALAGSGAVMWWKRKPADALGAPRAVPFRAGAGFALLLGALGLLLPLLGLSVLAILVIERLVLTRLPGPSRWLGLRAVPG
ncbi:MAG: PepSY domain-containing protein [Sphingomonadaceae bacterium]|nr:PepSY domain-containing protein [Sphingomonadaceae bacterium]